MYNLMLLDMPLCFCICPHAPMYALMFLYMPSCSYIYIYPHAPIDTLMLYPRALYRILERKDAEGMSMLQVALNHTQKRWVLLLEQGYLYRSVRVYIGA